ncbi:MFS transporter [Desulfosporosinus orientis]|uniref:MFS transporter n=1 Tax=Desulfosporosinus orientis TaxID=1563 RepID=UPI0003099E57|nr:MFS transporter [Desulfosporosinus orientis]
MNIYPPVKRPTAVALISTGFLLAGIVGQIVSSSIASSLGWPYVFISFAVVYVLAFLLTLAILPTVPVKHTGLSLFAVWKQMFGLLRDVSLVKGYTITFTLLLSFVGMYSSLGGYLANTHGLKPEQLLSIRAAGILGMMMSPFAGKFTARFGYKRVLLAGLIGATTGLWLEWAMPTVALITLASVVFVAGISIVVPTLINIIGILGKQARGGAVALYTFILFLGASAGPIIAALAGFKVISLVFVGILTSSTLLSLTLRIPKEGR